VDHGYFRGEGCPECDGEGKFLMSEEEMNRLGPLLAGVLRHFPDKFSLNMDSAGWVEVSAFIRTVKKRRPQFHWLRPHHLQAIVETDPKVRYQMEDGYVRAVYGHSLDLDLDLPTENIPEMLYYPSTREESEILSETGLKPIDRKKVHLSLTAEDAFRVGRFRVDDPIVLQIDSASIQVDMPIMQATETVFLVDEVEAKHITVLDDEAVAVIKAKVEEADASNVKDEAKRTPKAEPPVEKKEGPDGLLSDDEIRGDDDGDLMSEE